jgi:hypothetical protein
MPKIYDQELEDKRVIRMNEDRWFKLNQKALLWLVNTREGRDFLCIDQRFPVIHEIAKNFIRHHEFVRVEKSKKYPTGWKRVTTSEFRVGAKYANIIRYRWEAWQDYLADYHVALFLREMPRQYVPEYAMVRGQQASVMHTTTTVYPDPNPETTTMDGNAFRFLGVGSGEAWGTLRVGAGTGSADSSADDYYVEIGNDTTVNWRILFRSIFLFDTSSIPDTDIISAGTLSLRGNSKSDGVSITPDLNIYASTPASNTAIANADYNQTGGSSPTAFSTAVTYAGFSTSGYTDFALNASGLAAISKTGVSKFSARNANYDAANSAPTNPGAATVSILQGYFADQSGTTSDPKLVVTHAAPAVGHINLTLLGVG